MLGSVLVHWAYHCVGIMVGRSLTGTRVTDSGESRAMRWARESALLLLLVIGCGSAVPLDGNPAGQPVPDQDGQPGEPGPPGPPGPAGPEGPVIVVGPQPTVAVCSATTKRSASAACADFCGSSLNVVSFGESPCTVTSDTGFCSSDIQSLDDTLLVCCVCRTRPFSIPQ